MYNTRSFCVLFYFLLDIFSVHTKLLPPLGKPYMGLLHAEVQFDNRTGHLRLGVMIQTSERGATCLWKESVIIKRSRSNSQMYDVPLQGNPNANIRTTITNMGADMVLRSKAKIRGYHNPGYKIDFYRVQVYAGNLYFGLEFKINPSGGTSLKQHYHNFLGFRQGPPAVFHGLPVLSNINLHTLFGGYTGNFHCDVAISKYRLTKKDKNGNPEFESTSILFKPDVGDGKHNIPRNAKVMVSTMTADITGGTYKYANLNITKLKAEDFGLYSFAYHLNTMPDYEADRTGTKGYFIGVYAMTQTQVLLVGQKSLRNKLSLYIRSCTPGQDHSNQDHIGVQLGEVTCFRCTAYGPGHPEVKMLKGSRELSNVGRFSSGDLHEVIYTFRGVKAGDAGQYSCVAQEGSDVVKHHVTIKLFKHIYLTTRWKYHHQSKMLTLRCKATSEPVSRIKFYKVKLTEDYTDREYLGNDKQYEVYTKQTSDGHTTQVKFELRVTKKKLSSLLEKWEFFCSAENVLEEIDVAYEKNQLQYSD